MTLATPELNQSGQMMGSKGRRTRRKLIDTTVELLATTPLRDLKVVDITQAASTSAATFYVYFDNVIEVALAASAELTQSTPEIIATVNSEWTRANSHDRAVEMVDHYLAYWGAHRALMRTRNLAAEEGDIRFIRVREESIRPLILAMVHKIELAQREGRVSRRVFPYASGGTVLMMLERLGALARVYDSNGGVITFAQMREAAAHTIAASFGWPIQDDTAG
ncbi:TetR family transcriptional regulator [Sphingomonas immobilis]|uniref:TetR family transcriptional regulator n=1 Tax=Sphingomonas immobilis TaxID=3063997 RepID=A0ABT8ZYQ8_9SPHN|nr:TetR family transcriptional regulator [Sphingomonas sp. CA1-15]MDO7842254.1 TetR family transcriptional regulator [Sphingomonas sp. CA1-15]